MTSIIAGSSITLQMISVPASPNPTAKRDPILTIVFCSTLGSVLGKAPNYYSSILSIQRFFSSIYLKALSGCTAIFLTVSNMSSRGAMAANSKSLEKSMVETIRRIQTKKVLPMFMKETC